VVARAGGVERARAWHDPSTWGVYAIVLAAYVLLERSLRKPVPTAVAAADAHPLFAPGRARLVVALLLVGASVLAAWQLHRPAPITGALRLAAIPSAIGDWRGRDLEVTERQQGLLETRDVLLREYRGGADEVLACVAVAGPSSKAAHPPEVCYRGQGWHVVAQTIWDAPLGGRSRPLCELIVEREGARELVWSWYRVGADETESWWREQWLAVKARLAGRDVPAALLRFSTPVADPAGPEEQRAAQARLVRFLGMFLPVADAALAAPTSDREAAAESPRTR
jgi:EpsI family protein